MKGFFAPTQDAILTEQTYLTADVAAAATSIAVKNTDNFAANKYIVVGRLGEEGTELVKIKTVTDKTHLELDSALSFAHKANDPVTKIRYNQRKFYRSTDGGTVYNLLETKDIEVDNPSGTYFEDTTGLDSYYYKATYYNSQEVFESALADSDAMSGTPHDVGLDEIREEAGFKNNPYVTDNLIYQKRDEAESEVDAIIDIPSPTPTIVKQIIRDLAAGRLLVKDYGVGAADTTKDGYAKLKDARALLKQIADGELRIDDVVSQEGTGKFYYRDYDSYADRTEDEIEDDSKFSIHQEF